jgi:regulatory protein
VRREHSRAELERKLAPHAPSAEMLKDVLDLLLSRKQQSDERFAHERARVLSRKYGAAKIRQDLKARGVANEVIDGLPMEGEMERARAVLQKKFRIAPADASERARQARFLQSRGFSYEIIRGVLKNLD